MFFLFCFTVSCVIFVCWYKWILKPTKMTFVSLIYCIPRLKGTTEEITNQICHVIYLFITAGPFGWIVLCALIMNYIGYLIILILVSEWVKRSASRKYLNMHHNKDIHNE